MLLPPIHSRAHRIALAASLATLLASCGGGGGGVEPPVTGPGGGGSAPPELAQRVSQAAAEVRADTCFQQTDTTNCRWSEYEHVASDFAMTQSTGESVLVVDDFHSRPPLLAVRYGNRIKGIYEIGTNGSLAPVSARLRLPAVLLSVLSRFASPQHIPARHLAGLLPALQSAYGAVDVGTPGHGAVVLSLSLDASPHNPFVLLQALDLATMSPVDYCDASGSAAAQARLLDTARKAADALVQLMREHNVRFINYSAGHTLPVLRSGWSAACGTASPSDTVLREKLAAYQPLYAVLFNTAGVLAAQAAYPNSSPEEFPFDQPSADYANRLRVGYFTELTSGLDAHGRGARTDLQGYPGVANVDLYVNTGVSPARPFPYNRTPLLQTDRFGVDVVPITAPQTSWVTPLALARFINLRSGTFGGRTMDNSLVAEIFDAARPQLCSNLPSSRCLFQDVMLHGQIESIRLGYQPPTFVD